MTNSLITTLATERFVQYQTYSLVPTLELMLVGPIDELITPDSMGRLVGKSDYALRAGAKGWTLVQGKGPHNFGPPERQEAYRTPKGRIMLYMIHARAEESTLTLLIPEGDNGAAETLSSGDTFEVVNLDKVRKEARPEEEQAGSESGFGGSEETTDPGNDDIPF